jgi:hypothetical protein
MSETKSNAKAEKQANKAASDRFLNEVQKSSPNMAVLRDIIEKNPNLLSSREFLIKAFPKRNSKKGELGLEKIDRTMKTLRTIRKMQEEGILSEEAANEFMQSKNPKTGDTLATCVARNAVAACDKANIDRSPKKNLSEKDREVFRQQQQIYHDALVEMQELGVDINAKDNSQCNVYDIAQKAKIKDENGISPALEELSLTETAGMAVEKTNSAALQNVEENPNTLTVGIANEEENKGKSLEVGGENKEKLDVKIAGKPINLNINKPEEENEATVEEAPEDDQGKAGESHFSPVRERDIIDFMYNEWFLGGLNAILEKIDSVLTSATDKLCEKIKHTTKEKAKQNGHNTQQSNSQNSVRGQQILNNIPVVLHQRFNEQTGRFKDINDDLINNIGKNPPNWKTLDPNNPVDRKIIETATEKYNKNPTEFKQNLQENATRLDKQTAQVSALYKMALDAATVQYMQQQLTDGNTKFASLSDAEVQKQIQEMANKNFQAITVGIQAISEHTKLAAEAAGITTDPKKLDTMSAENVKAYIKLLQQQLATAKAKVELDVQEGNFKSDGKKPYYGSEAEVDKLNKIFEQSEHAGEVLTPTMEDKELLNLSETARFYSYRNKNANEVYQQIIESMDNVKDKQRKNKQRKTRLNEYKKRYKGYVKDKKFKEFINWLNTGKSR